MEITIKYNIESTALDWFSEIGYCLFIASDDIESEHDNIKQPFLHYYMNSVSY